MSTIQRFRGIATGWAVVVPGFRNELKAADRFIGPNLDGGARAMPKVSDPSCEEEIEQAWRDLWDLFEATRWLCARPETWSSKFGAGLRELLHVRERLAVQVSGSEAWSLRRPMPRSRSLAPSTGQMGWS